LKNNKVRVGIFKTLPHNAPDWFAKIVEAESIDDAKALFDEPGFSVKYWLTPVQCGDTTFVCAVVEKV
jgi:hypothetical protein